MNYAFNFNVIWANAGNLARRLGSWSGARLLRHRHRRGDRAGRAPSPRSTGRAALRRAGGRLRHLRPQHAAAGHRAGRLFRAARTRHPHGQAGELRRLAGALCRRLSDGSVSRQPHRHSCRPHRCRAFDRPDAAAGGAADPLADHAAQRAAGARLDLHLAVQGHLDRGRDRSARAHLPGAPHQRRYLPRGRGLDGGKRALCLDLAADRRRPAPARAPFPKF